MILNVIQIILSVLLVLLVLIQGKGSGIGAVFSGSSNVYRSRRGAESVIHYLTIFTSIAFFVVAIIQFI